MKAFWVGCSGNNVYGIDQWSTPVYNMGEDENIELICVCFGDDAGEARKKAVMICNSLNRVVEEMEFAPCSDNR